MIGRKILECALLGVASFELSGCASIAPYQQYTGKPDDPIFLVQSTPSMSGTIGRGSGTDFDVIYRNDQNECRRLFSERLQAPVDDTKLQQQFSNGQGIRLPANQAISVAARFSQRIVTGGGFLDFNCPQVTLTVLTEPKTKYLFEFSNPYGRCVLQAFKIKDDGKRELAPAFPGNICAPENNKKKPQGNQ